MPASDEPAAVPFEVSERDRDLMARTVYGEANRQDPRGQAAVAQVIVNRALANGYPDTVGGVVLQSGQFEPWQTRRGELLALPVDSRAYREARQTVDDVLAGTVPDMTGGATHFYAPRAQAALGRSAPAWARDPLAQEGGHVFYAPNGRVDRSAIGMPPGAGPASWATLDEAGVMPRSAGNTPSQPKGATMPKPAKTAETDDDALLSLYGVGPAAKTAERGAVASPAQPAGRMSDDDLLGLYTAAPAASPAAAKPGQDRQGAPVAALPLSSPDGVVDGNTGALVVGGKPFTDNSAGIWAGFQNFANGALLGAGVPLASAAAAVKEKALHGGNLSDLYAQARSAYGGAQERYQAEHPIAATATELAGSIPTTIAATALGGAALAAPGNALLRAAQGSELAAPLAAAGRFVTGGGAPAGGLAARIASRGVAGAAGGAFGGAINTGLTGGDVTGNALAGILVGGGAGAGLTGAGAAAGGLVNRLTGAASPEVAALARTARDTYGIPIRAGQITDSPAVRFTDSTLSRTPGMGYGAAERAQQTAVNRAVAQTIGEDADRLTPAVMQAARSRLGQAFDRVAAGSQVRADQPLVDHLAAAFGDAASVLTPAELRPLQNLVRDGIMPKFGTSGVLDGAQYQALTRKGAPLDRLMQSTNPNVKFYAGQIRDALDGALERSAPAELVQELRQARGQWRALRTIEDLAAKSPTGDISPAGLMQAVQRGYGSQVAYQGGGALGDLARIGQRFLKEPPSSGTAERIAAKDRLSKAATLATLAGGTATAAMGLNNFAPQLAAVAPGALGPALASTAAGFAGGRIASQILRSDALANRLIDRGLGTGQAGPVNRLLGLASGSAPEAAAPLYMRVRPSTPANDDTPANRLDEFMRNRPQRAGANLP